MGQDTSKRLVCVFRPQIVAARMLMKLPKLWVIVLFIQGLPSCDAQISRLDQSTLKIGTDGSNETPAVDAEVVSDPKQAPGESPSKPVVSKIASPAEAAPSKDTTSTNPSVNQEPGQTESKSVTPQPAVFFELGSDISANTPTLKTFSLTSDQTHELTWTKESGPGQVDLTTVSPTQIRLSASADGVYRLRGKVTVNDVLAIEDSFQFTWDTTGPQNAGGIFTAADSPLGADTRADNDTEIFVRWDDYTDLLSAPLSYFLTSFNQANCGGQGTEVALGTNSSLNYSQVTAAANTTMSFYVTAVDRLGNLTYSACSGTMTVDTIPPPSLVSASAKRGPQVQSIALDLVLPTDVADFGSLEVRRGAPQVLQGAAAPADCSSGEKVLSLSSFTTGQTISLVDDIGKAGHYVAYRICLADPVGNRATDVILDSDSSLATPLRSKEHILFVTSNTYKGNLGGPVGGLSGLALADSICQSAGQAATNPGAPAQANYVTSEVNWKAVLSDQDHDAQKRLIVSGLVRDQADQSQIASGRNDLWDGSILASVFFDEHGQNQGLVWSGSDRFGNRTSSHCQNWTSQAAGFGVQGDSLSSSDFNWLSAELPFAASEAPCSDQLSLYCLSQPAGVTWNPITFSLTSGLSQVTLNFPSVNLSYDHLSFEVWRIEGVSPPDSGCFSKTTETQVGSPPFSKEPFSWTDQTIQLGATYSYRICVKNDQGNILISQVLSGVSPL